MNKIIYFLAFFGFTYMTAAYVVGLVWETIANPSAMSGQGAIGSFLMLGISVGATLVLFWKYRETPSSTDVVVGNDLFDHGLKLFGVIMLFQAAQGFLSDGGFIISATGALGELHTRLLNKLIEPAIQLAIGVVCLRFTQQIRLLAFRFQKAA